MSASYSEKLRDPRWQRKRLEILQRDDFACQSCFDTETELQIHHLYYVSGREPWEYPDVALSALCKNCHKDHRGNPLWFEQGLSLIAKGEPEYAAFDEMAMFIKSVAQRRGTSCLWVIRDLIAILEQWRQDEM